MGANLDTAVLMQVKSNIEKSKKNSKKVTIYDSKDNFVFQGQIVYVNDSYFIVENDLNCRESFLLADIGTGERKVS